MCVIKVCPLWLDTCLRLRAEIGENSLFKTLLLYWQLKTSHISLVESEDLAEKLRLWPVDCWKGMATALQRIPSQATLQRILLHICTGSLQTTTSQTGELCGSLQWTVEEVRPFWRALEDLTWPFWSDCFWLSRFYFLIIFIHKSGKPQEISPLF